MFKTWTKVYKRCYEGHTTTGNTMRSLAGGLLLLCILLKQTTARYRSEQSTPCHQFRLLTIQFRMSEKEEQDFFKDYLTWMKGPGLDLESLTVYNFGYEGPLPFPSISLTPDTTMRFNLQTSGMKTQSRWSTVVVGGKHIERLGEIMTVIDRINKESQALPFSIYVERQ